MNPVARRQQLGEFCLSSRYSNGFWRIAIVARATSGHHADRLRWDNLGDEMSRRGWTSFLRAGSALGLLVVATTQTHAGGFAVREQSTYGQGTSFAGVAAGGALSSMYWNPATMTQVPGVVSESGLAGIFPFATHTPVSGTLVGILPGAPNSGEAALVPNSYMSLQLNPNLWLGLAINAPYGLSVNFPELWAGRNYGASSTLKTYNATPSIAWRINDWISVGAGVQIQYAKADLMFGLLPAFGSDIFLNSLTGWGYGATAGVTITPGPRTSIGLGWRSGINQDVSGTLAVNPLIGGTTPGPISTTVNLPDTVSLGIRHRFDDRWTVMGTAEWTNWSRIGTVSFAPATVGGVTVRLPFQYRDGWFFSGGAEYQWSDRLALRGGIAYEVSPVTDQVRMPDVPDNNRFWLSVGATWQVFRGLSFDLAYSHIWVQDPSINITAASGNPWFAVGGGVSYVGSVDAHVDILSASLVWRWGAQAEPKKALITK